MGTDKPLPPCYEKGYGPNGTTGVYERCFNPHEIESMADIERLLEKQHNAKDPKEKQETKERGILSEKEKTEETGVHGKPGLGELGLGEFVPNAVITMEMDEEVEKIFEYLEQQESNQEATGDDQ